MKFLEERPVVNRALIEFNRWQSVSYSGLHTWNESVISVACLVPYFLSTRVSVASSCKEKISDKAEVMILHRTVPRWFGGLEVHSLTVQNLSMSLGVVYIKASFTSLVHSRSQT